MRLSNKHLILVCLVTLFKSTAAFFKLSSDLNSLSIASIQHVVVHLLTEVTTYNMYISDEDSVQVEWSDGLQPFAPRFYATPSRWSHAGVSPLQPGHAPHRRGLQVRQQIKLYGRATSVWMWLQSVIVLLSVTALNAKAVSSTCCLQQEMIIMIMTAIILLFIINN